MKNINKFIGLLDIFIGRFGAQQGVYYFECIIKILGEGNTFTTPNVNFYEIALPLFEKLDMQSALDVIEIILNALGYNENITVPKISAIKRQIRNENIKMDFKGSNYAELAIKNNLNERTIRRIVSQ